MESLVRKMIIDLRPVNQLKGRKLFELKSEIDMSVILSMYYLIIFIILSIIVIMSFSFYHQGILYYRNHVTTKWYVGNPKNLSTLLWIAKTMTKLVSSSSTSSKLLNATYGSWGLPSTTTRPCLQWAIRWGRFSCTIWRVTIPLCRNRKSWWTIDVILLLDKWVSTWTPSFWWLCVMMGQFGDGTNSNW